MAEIDGSVSSAVPGRLCRSVLSRRRRSLCVYALCVGCTDRTMNRATCIHIPLATGPSQPRSRSSCRQHHAIRHHAPRCLGRESSGVAEDMCRPLDSRYGPAASSIVKAARAGDKSHSDHWGTVPRLVWALMHRSVGRDVGLGCRVTESSPGEQGEGGWVRKSAFGRGRWLPRCPLVLPSPTCPVHACPPD